MKSFLLTEPSRRVWVPVALIMRIGRLTLLIGHFLLPSVAINSSAAAEQPTKTYRTREFAFAYPSLFRIVTEKRGTVIRLVPRSRSQYWQDSIIIRKHNKKTEECDLPQDSHPENRDQRNIAGQPASAYSSEDAAMNRYVKTKGYMIEHGRFCWDFQLIRSGKPYRKFDLPENELKQLDVQSDNDSKAANAAFKLILDSSVFLHLQ
jgi:hypothetical protein